MHADEPLVLQPSYFEDEVAIDNQKRLIKSPDTDQIPAKMVRERGNTLCSDMRKLINCIWNKEEQPQQWNESIIVPIYKKVRKSGCNNSRRTSLLPHAYKMLYNILVSRLIAHVDEIIGDHQCAFRRNRSTINQISCIRQIQEEWLENKGTILQLFTHFEKTCDPVRREVLCSILIEFGIHINLIRLIKMFKRNADTSGSKLWVCGHV